MNKKQEAKILDRLRKKVIEKDMQLQQQEREKKFDVRETTKEVLAEMTVLDRREVDEIENQIREEVRIERERRNKNIQRALTVLLVTVIGFGIYFSIQSHNFKNKFRLVETFSDNKNNWDVFESYTNHRYIENGNLYFTTGNEDWNYWVLQKISLPSQYTVEAKSTWLKGKFDEYGIVLFVSGDNYASFQLHGDGTARAIRKQGEDSWPIQDNYKSGMGLQGDGETSNLQRVEVNGNRFRYFVNDQLVSENTITEFPADKIGFLVGGEQSIAFDYLTVKQGNRTLFNEDFSDNEKHWEMKKDFEKLSYLQDNTYVFQNNSEDYCHWTDIPVKIRGNYEVRAEHSWQKGELQDYGIMLMQDDTHYFAFEVRNDGSARYIQSENDEYPYIGDYIPARKLYHSKQKNEQKVLIKGNKFIYFLNDQKIAESDLKNLKLNSIGLRVCGRQTVAFNQISVQPMK